MQTAAVEPDLVIDVVCDGCVARVAASVEANLAQPISIDVLAEHSGLSRDRISRAIRDRTGLTIRGFIRDRRVDFACCRLALTQQSLAVVAASSGFASQAAMTAAFRRSLLTTPSSFRMSFGRQPCGVRC